MQVNTNTDSLKPVCTHTALVRGFTLIEIVVSLAIVSFGVVAIIDAMAKHTQVASELEARVVAGWVASNQVARMRYDAQINKLKIGNSSDTVKMGGFTWRTRANVTETEVEQVFLLTVEVKDAQRRDDPPFASVTTALTDRL
jgi:general secretion pathway protein I